MNIRFVTFVSFSCFRGFSYFINYMTYLILIILGVIQGLTEFLPVSSSGHLALLENIFKIEESQRLSYTAFLHLGTTLALFYVFRRKIIQIITNLFNKSSQTNRQASIKIIFMIIIGTIPAAIIGLTVQNNIERFFHATYYSSIFLLITGIILFVTKFARPRTKEINYQHAIIIGIAQAIALLPGISRSGTTISIALLLGLSREDSFEFSFLLSIPAIIGANLLVIKDITSNLSLVSIILSIIIPFIFGVFALAVLKRIVINRKLYYFAIYCWIVGIITLLFLK